MDTGKNELSKEYVQRIREALNDFENKYTPEGYMLLESLAVHQEEIDRLKEHPLKGVLGHVTNATRYSDGLKLNIKLNEKGREFLNDIYKKQQFDRDDIKYLINWDEIFDDILEEENNE